MMPEQRLVEFGGKQQAFPADATDAEISAALGAIPSSNAKDAPKAKTWTDLAVSALPVVGGAVGAATGGIPGAMLGAAGGEAWRQNIQRARGQAAPSTMGDAAKDIVVAGAESGALAGATKVAGIAAKAAYPAIVKGAATVTDSLSPDIVGLVSPRIAHALRIAQKAVDIATEKIAANEAPKMTLRAMDVVRIQSLKAQGITESEAVRIVMNLRAEGLLQ